MTRCDHTPAWDALHAHFSERGCALDLREAFATDATRFDRLSLQAPEVFADLSKNLIDEPTLALLLQMAEQCQLPQQRDALLRGDIANVTEGRAVLHTALRAPRGAGPFSDDVHEVLDSMLAYAERVRADGAITDIVNIGIGGSDLGPQMVVPALEDVYKRQVLAWVLSIVMVAGYRLLMRRLAYRSRAHGRQPARRISQAHPRGARTITIHQHRRPCPARAAGLARPGRPGRRRRADVALGPSPPAGLGRSCPAPRTGPAQRRTGERRPYRVAQRRCV